MKKFKLLPVLLLSIITVFSVTGCDEQKVLDSVVESDSKDTQKVLDDYHATCKKYNKYSLPMSDEFVTCLYEQDNEHFERLYDIQLEMRECIDTFLKDLMVQRGIVEKRPKSAISTIYILDNEKPTYDKLNNKIIFPMNYKIYSYGNIIYTICVRMEVNMNDNELPKMEELNKDYKFAIECFYAENGERIYTCSPDGENIYAGTLENYEENSSVYALEMPDPDPIESHPENIDLPYDPDDISRTVSATTVEPVDPEANMSAKLKADLAMLRAMGYNPTGSGYKWECKIDGPYGSYAVIHCDIFGKYWWANQISGVANTSNGIKVIYPGVTMYSSDLINFYDVTPGTNKAITKHLMLTRDGMRAISF